MKVLYSGYKDPNHSSAGGYDKIIGFPNSNYICDKNVPFGFIKVNQHGKSINLFFLDIATRFLRRKYDITHIFYGDNIIAPYKRLAKHKLVTTIHLDISKHKRLPKLFIRSLKGIDGVIVLSSLQEEQLTKMGIKAKFIPHGFSTPNFNYAKPISFRTLNLDEKVNIAVSGTNYRDITTLIKSISYTERNVPNIMFHIMGQRDQQLIHKLESHNNVICYNRLSDDEYFSVLQSCDYTFLPLSFATANNALLEAQFLGTKSILPDIPGIQDYAAPYPMNVYYKDVNELISIFKNCIKSNKSESLIKYSQRFLWKNIYNELEKYYCDLLH